MATITDRRKIVDLLSIIVRIQYVPARPDTVKEYYKKVIKNQWYEVKVV